MKRSSRALVTGGAGVVGSAVVDFLVGAGTEVVVLDQMSRGRPEHLDWACRQGRVTIIDDDIRDRDAVRAAMRGVNLVFHQAAIRITHCAEDPRLALEVMVDGTYNVIEAAAAARVHKLVAASSASIYGMATVFPTPEDHAPYANRTMYGAAKLFNESLLRSFNEMHDLHYVALRYFNVYGPRMATRGPHTEVLIRWIERIERGEPPLIFGDGSDVVDLIHVNDVARANMLAAVSLVTDDVFNIGSGHGVTLCELATRLLKVMGSPLQPEFAPARDVNPVPRRVADTSKATRLLGFRAETDLDTGLAELVAWWREQQPVDLDITDGLHVTL
jgi:UDP-glucose 4-epimerase